MRWPRRIAVALAAAVAVAAAAGWIALRASLPTLGGELAVAGVDAEIAIRRDAYGIPHIDAGSERDAWFGLGFVHGQDRLSQIAFMRLAGRGELASVLGAGFVGSDRYFRTLGFGRVSARNVDAVPADSRRLLEAYAAGVTAAIDATRWLPPELLALGHRPAPWTPADSVLAVKLMALRLSGNAMEELLRAEMKRALPSAVFATAWPGSGSAPVPPDAAAYRGTGAAMPAPAPRDTGSNNWVVGPARSKTGAPILANDPHLALTAPATWYLAHLSAPGFDVAGATVPGIPAIVVGRTRDAAWGVTNTGPDVQDVFVVDEADVTGRSRERIAVRGRDPVAHDIRTTPFGPVVSDLARFAGERLLALSWTALEADDATVDAGFRLARARSVEALFEALERFSAPMQNFVLADAAGNIGFVAAGRVPVRRDHDGWLPTVAADGNGEWIGRLPYDVLPRLYNPPGGAIFTANQDIRPPGYGPFIGRDWAEDYRARRIAGQLAGRERHGVADFAALQTDEISLMALEFLPLMLPAVADSPHHARLAAWDGRMAADRPEPLIFHAWYRALAQGLIARNLPAFRDRYRGRRPAMVRRVLGEDPSWCGADGCDAVIARALDEALAWLSAAYGSDPGAWRWGDAHKAVSRHALTDAIPVVRDLFAIERPHGGGPYTVMQGNTRIDDAHAPFAEIHGASVRIIVDLADADGMRAIVHAGQSGHPLSPHYADMADLWAEGGYLTLPMTPAAVAAATRHTLRLVPRG